MPKSKGKKTTGKAVSKSQQRLMGMVHAYNKGELTDVPDVVRQVAKSMKKKDTKEFAKTKHKGLPEKVKPKKKKTKKKRASMINHLVKLANELDKNKREAAADKVDQIIQEAFVVPFAVTNNPMTGKPKTLEEAPSKKEESPKQEEPKQENKVLDHEEIAVKDIEAGRFTPPNNWELVGQKSKPDGIYNVYKVPPAPSPKPGVQKTVLPQQDPWEHGIPPLRKELVDAGSWALKQFE